MRGPQADEVQGSSEERVDVEALQASSYNEDGVDLTLIDWMLSLTPRQRLAVLQDHINFFAPFVPDEPDAQPCAPDVTCGKG